MLDMTESIAPKSDQLNAEDLLTGPRTFTIAEVKRGDAEQPIHVHLVEHPGRPFKPSKTVRRIMVGAWGPDASTYVGKRMTLYRDPAVRFGGQDVGGIRVSHMSHIDKRLTLALTVTRGKRAPYVIEPLADAPTQAAGVTEQQMRALLAAFHDAGITEREAMLTFAAKTAGRPIRSATDLTSEEATKVAEALEAVAPSAASDPAGLPHGDETGGADPATDGAWPETARIPS